MPLVGAGDGSGVTRRGIAQRRGHVPLTPPVALTRSGVGRGPDPPSGACTSWRAYGPSWSGLRPHSAHLGDATSPPVDLRRLVGGGGRVATTRRGPSVPQTTRGGHTERPAAALCGGHPVMPARPRARRAGITRTPPSSADHPARHGYASPEQRRNPTSSREVRPAPASRSRRPRGHRERGGAAPTPPALAAEGPPSAPPFVLVASRSAPDLTVRTPPLELTYTIELSGREVRPAVREGEARP